ncbi:MAG TPA: META domain-containing protein [Anaerolineae bacterium]|nr:META domain-containing protein [Anaerolineae bacterium]
MNGRHIATLTLAAAILLVLAACAGAGGTTGDPLKGTSWRLTTLGGAGLIPGTEITATFEDGEVSGKACNIYGGKYQVSGDTLTISQVFMTEMACVDPQGIMEQETAFFNLLTSAQSFKLTDGGLRILGAGGEELTFAPAQ